MTSWTDGTFAGQHYQDQAAGRADARAVLDGTADAATLARVTRLAGALQGGVRTSDAAQAAGVSVGYAVGVLAVARQQR